MGVDPKRAASSLGAMGGKPKQAKQQMGASQFDLQWCFFSLLSFPAEALLHSNYSLCFWAVVAITTFFVSKVAAVLVLFGALFALMDSYSKPEPKLPRYRGALDVLLGRHFRASTLTPDCESNNNVSIASYADRLVVAYRKADTHFASPHARIIVATSTLANMEEWTEVWEFTTGEDDLREVLLFKLKDQLFLYYVCLAPFKRGFAPRSPYWTATNDLVTWSKPQAVGRATEIVWDVKVRTEEDGTEMAYKASYIGNHYAADAECAVLFEKSADGKTWGPVGEESTVYVGGICEVSFAFTKAGDLVAIGRNEDGDATGFGSQLFFARSGDLGKWTPLRVSVPYRFDSPRLICERGELVLFARYAQRSYCTVPGWFPFALQRIANLLTYSLLPKAAAVYRICPPGKDGAFPKEPIELIRGFEDCFGDTGFFSVATDEATGDNVIANYSSTCHSHAPWIYGQVFATDIFVCRAQFIWNRT